MENLRVRYVITYKSTSAAGDPNTPRTIRVKIVEANAGKPLEIVDTNGQPLRSRIFVEKNYVPGTVEGTLNTSVTTQ